jgi:hypothetical protein
MLSDALPTSVLPEVLFRVAGAVVRRSAFLVSFFSPLHPKGSDAPELSSGLVLERDPTIGIGRVDGSGQQVEQRQCLLLPFAQGRFRALAVGDVLEAVDGPDNCAIVVFDGYREPPRTNDRESEIAKRLRGERIPPKIRRAK